jgi:hypothetical protein
MTVRFGGATVKEVRRAGQRGQVRLIRPSTACCAWAWKWPAYSPVDNPLEHLWKNMKKRATPQRYFPPFAGAAQRVTLTNTGTAVLSIARIAIASVNLGDFAIAARTCGATLAPAASCMVDVTFTPTTRHTRSGTLAITDSTAGSPHSMALTGNGL